VSGRDGHDDLSGLGGNDWLDGGAGFDQLHGGDGDDTLTGGKDGDGLYGEANNDLLFGNDGNDGLFGDDGNDTLDGGAGADVLRGGNGYDIASYADAAARVSIDFLTSATWTGDAEGDFLDSIEEIHLTGFDDTFRGDPRFDIVVDGGAGNDFIYCVSHNDTLRGGFGNDTLVGGMGGDLLVGGADADIFKYLTVEDSQNILINGVLQQDQILDFTQGQDKIDLSTIDADPGLPGDQAFVFVADPAHYTGNWTGVVAQITWADGTASICASTDADPECEFIIYMSHPYQFTANDFIL
jgi:Ca2+-binding RTX toxin-like protein